MFPFEATANGDNRYNDKMYVDISESYRDSIRSFFKTYSDKLHAYKLNDLDSNDRISYQILDWDLQRGIESMKFDDHLIPINQFWALPITFAQLGSGKSNQPFNNTQDYKNWLKRVDVFPAWCDTAIANMRRGIQVKMVLPEALILKMIPQMKELAAATDTTSVYYMPVKNFPADMSDADKKQLTADYTAAIHDKIIPAYQRLSSFLSDEYLKAGRKTSGISDVPDGRAYYDFLARYWTTTDLNPDQIFNIGEQEVKRIRTEMERIKDSVGFKGDLKAFFKYLNTDKKFMPYKSTEEVLAAYHSIYDRIKPQIPRLFSTVPSIPFEIRRTESFREKSASAEYNQGTPDGKRPGIFYVPVPDAKKFNQFGMESLFLHEAIPGHHFQISLQQENKDVPEFRKFNWYGAYGEGWALYTESLGKELGLYQDPYQYFGALSGEMHRAIRLVVDAGLHTKGWTREQAIQFSLDNEGESEESVISEIERYMAIPGQALAYKIGQMKIRELRNRAQESLGNSFDIREFHHQVLKNGCLPLAVFESEMNHWIESSKAKSNSQ